MNTGLPAKDKQNFVLTSKFLSFYLNSIKINSRIWFVPVNSNFNFEDCYNGINLHLSVYTVYFCLFQLCTSFNNSYSIYNYSISASLHKLPNYTNRNLGLFPFLTWTIFLLLKNFGQCNTFNGLSNTPLFCNSKQN